MFSQASGDDWRRHRSVITSALTTSKIKQTFEFKDCKDILVFIEDRLGEDVDVYNMFTMELLNLSTRALYGLDLDLFKNTDHEIIPKAQAFFTLSQGTQFVLENVPFWILKLLNVSAFEAESSEYIKQLVIHAVQERIKDPKSNKKDLLQSLLEAGKEETDGKGLNEIEVMSNAIIMLAAAFDTSTMTSAFVSYELAKNPDKQNLVQEEIDSVLNNNQSVEYEDLNKFPYMEAAIYEALRLHAVDQRVISSLFMACDQ